MTSHRKHLNSFSAAVLCSAYVSSSSNGEFAGTSGEVAIVKRGYHDCGFAIRGSGPGERICG